MNLFKILASSFALLIFLNSVDIHALSHLVEGDEHKQIENCQTCEEFVVSSKENISILPAVSTTPTKEVICFFENPLRATSPHIFINQEKYLGKFHNKPPPSLV